MKLYLTFCIHLSQLLLLLSLLVANQQSKLRSHKVNKEEAGEFVQNSTKLLFFQVLLLTTVCIVFGFCLVCGCCLQSYKAFTYICKLSFAEDETVKMCNFEFLRNKYNFL